MGDKIRKLMPTKFTLLYKTVKNIGTDVALYQSFTNRTHIRNGRRFAQSEISQIVEKNICCSVILSGLIQLKSTPQTEYIVLPYNIRRLHCGYCWMAEFCAVKNGPFKTMPIQHRTNRSAFRSSPLKLRIDELLSKWLRLEKLRGQSDCRNPYSIDDTINEHYPNR